MASAPQIAANAAGASHEFLVTSAEWVVGLVLKSAGSYSGSDFYVRPSGDVILILMML